MQTCSNNKLSLYNHHYKYDMFKFRGYEYTHMLIMAFDGIWDTVLQFVPTRPLHCVKIRMQKRLSLRT